MEAKVESSFAEKFPGVKYVTAMAPGRINIIGEHTDYSGGYFFSFASRKSTRMTTSSSLQRSGSSSQLLLTLGLLSALDLQQTQS